MTELASLEEKILNIWQDLENNSQNNFSNQNKLDNKLVQKFAPKIAEGTKRLKAWVEST